MSAKPFAFTKSFVRERCDLCGDCLVRCPVLAYPADMAREEMQALLDGRPNVTLLHCTGCMACNSFCPTEANPHTLIVTRWNERYRREGLPARGAAVLPYQEPNLYTRTITRLPADEQALADAWRENWRNPPQADTMVYAGCNMLLQPFLMDSRLFQGMTIFGATSLCCGEPLYRMGCWDAERVVAQHLKSEFARMGFKRLIVPCLAGYHLFRYVYPEVFDVHFDFEVVSILDFLDERLAAGDLEIKPLGLRATLHDNCWPKASGERIFERSRALLARLGVEIVEPAHTRESALCCGMCAGAARFSLRDTLRASKRRLKELRATGADMAIDYCGGCGWMFGLADLLSLPRRRMPVYHLLEVVQRAIGEVPKRRTNARVRTAVRAILGQLALAYLNPKRFWIRDIAGHPVPQQGKPEP